MAYESCGCDESAEMVDEMESEDQMDYNVAEDNPPDTGAAEVDAEDADVAAANSAAASFDQAQAAPDAAADLATESEDEELDEFLDVTVGQQGLGGSASGGSSGVAGVSSTGGSSGSNATGGSSSAGSSSSGNRTDQNASTRSGAAAGQGNSVSEEDELEESYANGADDTFDSDIEFMTNIISGGANKRKSTGQTTIPVVSTQLNRLGNPMKESTDLLSQWKKLSGI
jgi:hypothetical protein